MCHNVPIAELHLSEIARPLSVAKRALASRMSGGPTAMKGQSNFFRIADVHRLQGRTMKYQFPICRSIQLQGFLLIGILTTYLMPSTAEADEQRLPELISATASAQDCKFPTRGGKGKQFVEIQAGNGGEWEKRGYLNSTQKGYFRFIYYGKGQLSPIRLFVEAWESQDKYAQPDVFVGCMEVIDSEISKAKFLGEFEFSAADEYSINLNMRLTESAPPGSIDSMRSRQYRVRVPFSFISNIY